MRLPANPRVPYGVLLGVFALLLAGCLDPTRLNPGCRWTGDSTRAALDLSLAADRRHLTNDARIAGENATRYRDSVHKQLGFGAAGTLDVECLDRLYATIGAQHRVGRADLDTAAGRRDVLIDVALVYLPLGLIFLFVASRLCRRAFARLGPPGERWTAVLGAAWVGLGASAVATAAAYLYMWNIDTLRLRDFHMSFRASYIPIGRHTGIAFLVAFAVYAIAAVVEYRAARSRPNS